MRLGGWRRFRPRVQKAQQGNVFERAGKRLEATLEAVYGRGWPNIRVEQLPKAIEYQRGVVAAGDVVDSVVLLVLQAPQAARAQDQMDHHKHGYRGREHRLFELIDFNDAFVASVLALKSSELHGFTEHAKAEIDRFCESVGGHSFSDEQWEAITRGLTREVAVYRGARQAGFWAEMTDRRADAMGVDMVVGDEQTRRFVNIDCKTPSAYFLRLQELVEQGRLSEDVAAKADRQGHCLVVNGRHSDQHVEVVLLRVSPEVFGEVEDFAFPNQRAFEAVIRQIIVEYGKP